jgi:hypothetical protein
MFDVIEMIYLRLAKLFAKKGYVDASGEVSLPEDNDCDVPMPFRPRAPKAYRRKGRLLANPPFKSTVSAFRSRCDVSSRLA